jgi:hypothetical protein
MAIQLITARYGEMSVQFQENGFINATAIAKQFNKQPRDYLKTEQTKNYINSIKRIFLIDENQLVIVKKGSVENGGGTWLHPKLAIDFARWLSPDFAVWCDLQIERILHSNAANDTLSEFLKPITETIDMRDFEWRKQAICQLIENLKKTQVSMMMTISGEELLVGKCFEK